jgi:ABC-2 type transport system ATP-binding protein
LFPLEVRSLSKTYPSFRLKSVSFSLEAGKITGFIGRNGAGKSTTLKSLFNLVHPESGTVRFFGENFTEHEISIKCRVGFVAGGTDYYPRKPLHTITGVTKLFYHDWDDGDYRKYITQFGLDESKTPSQLSTGMKVKYALALALSHHAELLILDEPTSGLDPVSRDELLDLFMELSRKGTTVLFSTHITSDLDKCADNILYIKDGAILAESTLPAFSGSYRLTEVAGDTLPPALKKKAAGLRRTKDGYSVLLQTADTPSLAVETNPASLEEIMIHLERGVNA